MTSAFDLPSRSESARITRGDRQRPPLKDAVAGNTQRGLKYSQLLIDNYQNATTFRDSDMKRLEEQELSRSRALGRAMNDMLTSVHRLERANLFGPWLRAAEDFALSFIPDATGIRPDKRLIARLMHQWRCFSPLEVSAGYYRQHELQTAYLSAESRSTPTEVAMYAVREATQQLLAAIGITEVTVYRALRWRASEDIPLSNDLPEWFPTNIFAQSDSDYLYADQRFDSGIITQISPMAGYTLDRRIAELLARRKGPGGVPPYGYAILECTVPAGMVISTPLSGIGNLAKSEVVLDVPASAYKVSIGLSKYHLDDDY